MKFTHQIFQSPQPKHPTLFGFLQSGLRRVVVPGILRWMNQGDQMVGEWKDGMLGGGVTARPARPKSRLWTVEDTLPVSVVNKIKTLPQCPPESPKN